MSESTTPADLPSTAHVVYCEGRMVLDRGPYSSWQDIEREYIDYTTSLGPWSAEEIIAFFEEDFGDDEKTWPFSRDEIESFFASKDKVLEKDRNGPPIDITFDE